MVVDILSINKTMDWLIIGFIFLYDKLTTCAVMSKYCSVLKVQCLAKEIGY